MYAIKSVIKQHFLKQNYSTVYFHSSNMVQGIKNFQSRSKHGQRHQKYVSRVVDNKLLQCFNPCTARTDTGFQRRGLRYRLAKEAPFRGLPWQASFPRKLLKLRPSQHFIMSLFFNLRGSTEPSQLPTFAQIQFLMQKCKVMSEPSQRI